MTYEKKRESTRRWRADNPEVAREVSERFRRDNRERLNGAVRARYGVLRTLVFSHHAGLPCSREHRSSRPFNHVNGSTAAARPTTAAGAEHGGRGRASRAVAGGAEHGGHLVDHGQAEYHPTIVPPSPGRAARSLGSRPDPDRCWIPCSWSPPTDQTTVSKCPATS